MGRTAINATGYDVVISVRLARRCDAEAIPLHTFPVMVLTEGNIPPSYVDPVRPSTCDKPEVAYSEGPTASSSPCRDPRNAVPQTVHDSARARYLYISGLYLSCNQSGEPIQKRNSCPCQSARWSKTRCRALWRSSRGSLLRDDVELFPRRVATMPWKAAKCRRVACDA